MNEPKEPEIKEMERGVFQIPDCCKSLEGNCRHVAQKPKKNKQNVGL